MKDSFSLCKDQQNGNQSNDFNGLSPSYALASCKEVPTYNTRRYDAMINTQMTEHNGRSVTLAEYAADLTRSGIRILPGSRGAIWTRFDANTMVRRPIF